MSHSLSSRAQTEPLAALLAVGIMGTALGLYVVTTQPLLPGGSDDATAEQTLDLVWNDIQDDGVFHAYPGAASIADSVTGDSLPEGSRVHVTVTAVDGGAPEPVATASFPRGYPWATDESDRHELEDDIETEGVPADASRHSRSVPVALESSAEIRSGTLEVAVW